VDEILPGVFHWQAVHPSMGAEVGSYFVAGSGTAIDPLLPEEGVEWFEGRGVERVVLSNRHHLRHGRQLAERFDCPILCHEAGLHEFEGGPAVAGFAFGERLAGDVVALEMDAICPEDTVLRVEAGGGALLFADSLIYGGDEVGFIPDHHLGDDPEAVKREIRAHAAKLMEEDFEHLLFSHDQPLLGDGREALAAVAAG
jgi:hypothetical protein